MKHILSCEVSILLNSAKASYANTLGLIENINQSIKSSGLDIEVEINSKGNICAFNHKAKNCPEILMTEDELIEYIENYEENELEARAESYGSDLCCICRECDECETNPCRLKIDAMNGYKDGLKKNMLVKAEGEMND